MIIPEYVNSVFKSVSTIEEGFEAAIELQLIVQYFSDLSHQTTSINAEGLKVKKNDFFLIDSLARVLARNPNTVSEISIYPALMDCNLSYNTCNEIQFIEIFPRTLNSEMSSSITDDEGTNKNSSHSYTSGSSNSQSNSFGVNIGYSTLQGFSAGVDYRLAIENSSHRSNTIANDTGYRLGQSVQVSMSIKDWGAFGIINQKEKQVDWKWGQTYPWDAISFNQRDYENFILLPGYMTRRLLINETKSLTSPNHLSMYGVDFLMTSKTKIKITDNTPENSFIKPVFNLEMLQAKNAIIPQGEKVDVKVKIDPNSRTLVLHSEENIDLYQVSLIQLSEKNSLHNCNIFFDTDPYIYFKDKNFRVNSSINNLLIDGLNFNFSKEKGLVALDETSELEVFFKIIDNAVNYDLILMHWLEGNNTGVQLQVEINDCFETMLEVNFTEGKGGHNNRSVISLRNTDFNSAHFHDFLLLGLNKIKIKIKKKDPKTIYKLYGISIT